MNLRIASPHGVSICQIPNPVRIRPVKRKMNEIALSDENFMMCFLVIMMTVNRIR
ncbi:hypothetical protein PANA5342_pPANA10100 (plasmid) [Pantoea ananatis LMG 5342]|nr:hypothetical protein PANA5342_pPANA10100 [Pantoea ananatis LMG 5342]